MAHPLLCSSLAITEHLSGVGQRRTFARFLVRAEDDDSDDWPPTALLPKNVTRKVIFLVSGQAAQGARELPCTATSDWSRYRARRNACTPGAGPSGSRRASHGYRPRACDYSGTATVGGADRDLIPRRGCITLRDGGSPLIVGTWQRRKYFDDPLNPSQAPWEIRAPDHCVRSRSLYPTELRAHFSIILDDPDFIGRGSSVNT